MLLKGLDFPGDTQTIQLDFGSVCLYVLRTDRGAFFKISNNEKKRHRETGVASVPTDRLVGLVYR